MAPHTTKVFGEIQLLNKGFNEVQVLHSALVNTTIPFDADLVEAGVIRVDWNGPAVESCISAFNDDFAREIDRIVRHPDMAGMGLYGQFMIITNGFNDTMGMTIVTVADGQVFVEKGEPAWTTPIRRI
jgi:hypothetical protein